MSLSSTHLRTVSFMERRQTGLILLKSGTCPTLCFMNSFGFSNPRITSFLELDSRLRNTSRTRKVQLHNVPQMISDTPRKSATIQTTTISLFFRSQKGCQSLTVSETLFTCVTKKTLPSLRTFSKDMISIIFGRECVA